MGIEMLWGSQAEKMVRDCFDRAKQGAEFARRLDSEHCLDMLEDDWLDKLGSYVRSLYTSDELFELIKPHISTEHNLYKRIGTELSQVYKWGALRELADPREHEKAAILWEETEIDETLEHGNLLGNTLRDLAVLPWVDDGRMHLHLITPDRMSVIQHPRVPWLPLAFWFDRAVMNTADGIFARLFKVQTTKIEHVLVDDQRYAVFDVQGKLLEEVVHGIGRIPAVFFHASKRTTSFFLPTEFKDVYQANLHVGWLLSGMSFMQKMQAEKQVTYQGDPDDIAEGTAMGAHEVLAAKGPFSTLDLQADPKKYIDHINERIRLIALNYGLGADTYELKTAASGFSFKLQRMPLLEARRKQVKKWRRIERELYTVMALVAQRFHYVKPDPLAEFSINYAEPTFVEDPATENRVDKEAVDLGMASRVDIMMRRDPDLTRKEAIAKARRILEEESVYVGWAKELNTSMAPDGTEKSPEENGRDGAKARGRGGGGDVKAFAREALQRIRKGA